VADWREIVEREDARFADGRARLPDDPDVRQRQLTRVGNAAYGGGLAALMLGDAEGARRRLGEAARAYRESFGEAPPGSWGRPIGAIKARVLADDWTGARDDAAWALGAGAEAAESPIGRYAAALALDVLERYEDARVHADAIRIRDDFPQEVGDALAFVAAGDVPGYVEAVEQVLESFETREEYLEDVPVADTVLVLQALAGRRGMAADLRSPLLPGGAT
jgi:hypothetical protein